MNTNIKRKEYEKNLKTSYMHIVDNLLCTDFSNGLYNNKDFSDRDDTYIITVTYKFHSLDKVSEAKYNIVRFFRTLHKELEIKKYKGAIDKRPKAFMFLDAMGAKFGRVDIDRLGENPHHHGIICFPEETLSNFRSWISDYELDNKNISKVPSAMSGYVQSIFVDRVKNRDHLQSGIRYSCKTDVYLSENDFHSSGIYTQPAPKHWHVIDPIRSQTRYEAKVQKTNSSPRRATENIPVSA